MLVPPTPPPMTIARACSTRSGPSVVPRLAATDRVPARGPFGAAGARRADRARAGAATCPRGRPDLPAPGARAPVQSPTGGSAAIATIDEVIAAIPEWAGRTVTVEPIAAGLTNANYRVVVDGMPVFVRIPGPSTDLLAVDRANEAHNTLAAARSGVGPRVLHHLPETGVLVLEWLPGRTMSNEAFATDGMPARVAAALRRLHGGPRFRDDFDMFRLAERYLRVCDERSFLVPDGYRELVPAVGRIEAAFAEHPLATVPCHNDLLAENYLDDGTDLRIVDYEYSGNNDPTFELGNTCQELAWDNTRVEALCAAYFGEATPALLARMHLNMIMSDVGWTLWAAIQARISPIDYDFWAWAVERWDRAEATLRSPDLEAWLAEVRSADR
ncbi:MAG: phosphotransferase [Candidatus Limnocylindrales bacterium]